MVNSPKGLQGQYAGFVTRAIGLVVDILIVLAIIGVVNAAIALTLGFFLGIDVASCPPLEREDLFSGMFLCHAANWLRVFLTIFVGPAYFGALWALGGQTLGQYAMGLRVVRLDGRRMTFVRSLVRWFGYFVSFFALGLGFLWVLWDDRRQGFADKLAKTVVVYSWQARQNEFLLDRIRQRLRRRRKAVAAPQGAAPAPVTTSVQLELVVTVFPSMAKVREAMDVLQDAIREGALHIITSIVMVKDETGALGYVGSSDLTAGDESLQTDAALASDPRLQRINAQNLTAGIANGSFILAIIVEDKQLSSLLKILTAAKVAAQVFDLDTPSHAPLVVSSDGQEVAQPAISQQAATPPEGAQPSADAPPEMATESIASVVSRR